MSRKTKASKKSKAIKKAKPGLKLDIGCGPNKAEGFHGVDVEAFPGVDTVFDVRKTPWPWKDGSVDAIRASHFVEHLTGAERITFFNECYRVLKEGNPETGVGQLHVVCPHWSHNRAYGDPTHQWPPVSDWTFYYLSKDWRDKNAPHVKYKCNFDWVLAGSFDPNDTWVSMRNQETRAVLTTRNINCSVDIIATLTKRPMP